MLLQLFLCFSIALSALVHQDHAAESHLTQYGHHYKTLVLDLRNRTINILHIGECSADLCARYKPDSVIYCTDILSPAEWELSNTHVSFCNGPPHTFPKEFDKQLDMIVDTRKFALSPFESTLVSLFGTLKAGGFYFVEGVDYGNEGHVIQDSPDLLRADTNHVFHNNHVYMVDTSVPRRMNSETYGEAYTAKGRMHDDYLLVVRKRIGAVPEVKVNSGHVAMYGDGIVTASVDSVQTLLLHTQQAQLDYIETLAFRYGPDKSKDDHKYTDFYTSLYTHTRHNITSVLEIGIAAGQSLQMWSDYFDAAIIYGVDLGINHVVINNLAVLDRVYLFVADCQSSAGTAVLPLQHSSVDLIIDDGPHAVHEQDVTLQNFWKFLRPGGVYVIEDVGFPPEGTAFVYAVHKLSAFTQQILRSNEAYLVDTLVGHRAYDAYKRVTGISTNSRVDHNSHLFVIHKRIV